MSQFENSQQTGRQVIVNTEKLRLSHNLKQYSKLGYFSLGVAAFSFTYAFVNKYYLQNQAQEKIEFRKSRLSQPVTELSGAHGTQIPWSQKNVDEWMFRRVRITGRPLHNRTCMIPAWQHGIEGYYYVVPLCTKETEKGEPIEGVLLNKGFIPKYYANVAHRPKIEDSFHQQTFDCYVSQMEEHQKHGLLTPGNTPYLPRNKWNYVNLKEMAEVTDFQNKSTAGACVLESVNFDTPLDERNSHITDISSDYKEDYPYRKTIPGALQANNMPWDYRNTASRYFNIGLASAVFGIFLVA